MSDNKKDLTRIEDLGEYLHELSEDESTELPEIPSEETDFSTSEEVPDFAGIEEDVPDFGGTEEVPDFNSPEETTTFETNDDTPFTIEETSDFSTDFNSDSDNTFTVEEADPFEPEPEVEFEPEPEVEAEPEPIVETTRHYEPEPEPVIFKAPENFADLKRFAESTSVTGMGAEGNPSFSVLLKNVRYIEDINDILSMMRELGLMSDPEEQIRQRLMRGHLLIPRISEYAAIFLAHKLRRFDIDIQVGLSDEIHPPKHQETPETGLVSKYSLYQNQSHNFQFADAKLDISQIIVAATPHLEGHQVLKYLGVASEHKMLDGHIVEDEGSSEIPRHYSELAQKLKAHALKAHANAVIGLNYQLTPLPSEYGLSGAKYRLSCTGNLVWVTKL